MTTEFITIENRTFNLDHIIRFKCGQSFNGDYWADICVNEPLEWGLESGSRGGSYGGTAGDTIYHFTGKEALALIHYFDTMAENTDLLAKLSKEAPGKIREWEEGMRLYAEKAAREAEEKAARLKADPFEDDPLEPEEIPF